jgi:hypothetical protein
MVGKSVGILVGPKMVGGAVPVPDLADLQDGVPDQELMAA